MFGYATDETEECMPLTIVLAHKLNAKMAELRRNGTIPWLRPDSKTQVRNDAADLSVEDNREERMWLIGVNHCVPPPPSPQVTVHYDQKDGAVIPKRVHTIVISVQHDDYISLEEQKKVLKEKVGRQRHSGRELYVIYVSLMWSFWHQVINAVVPAKYLDDKTIYHLQPSGRFVIGGPQVTPSTTRSLFS